MKTTLAAAAALLMSLPSGSAFAGTFNQDRVVLSHADLDLSTATGQRRLSSRLREAAVAVCGDRMYSLHLVAAAKSQRCQSEVIAFAKGQIDRQAARPLDGSRTAAVRMSHLPIN